MEFTYKLIRDNDAESPKGNTDDHESGRLFLATTANRYFDVSHPLVPREGRSYRIPESVRESHHIFPLHMYAHSGVALSLSPFSCPWDSGQVGHVFVTKDTSEITDAETAAKTLVEEWNQYLSGDVYGYEISDKDGSVVDSCWGFYGREYAEEQAKEALGIVVENAKKEEERIAAMMHL